MFEIHKQFLSCFKLRDRYAGRNIGKGLKIGYTRIKIREQTISDSFP